MPPKSKPRRVLDAGEIQKMAVPALKTALHARSVRLPAHTLKQGYMDALIAFEAARAKELEEAAAAEEAAQPKKKLRVLSKDEIMGLHWQDLRREVFARGERLAAGSGKTDLQNFLIQHEAARAEEREHEDEDEVADELLEEKLPLGTRVVVSGSRWPDLCEADKKYQGVVAKVGARVSGEAVEYLVTFLADGEQEWLTRAEFEIVRVAKPATELPAELQDEAEAWWAALPDDERAKVDKRTCRSALEEGFALPTLCLVCLNRHGRRRMEQCLLRVRRWPIDRRDPMAVDRTVSSHEIARARQAARDAGRRYDFPTEKRDMAVVAGVKHLFSLAGFLDGAPIPDGGLPTVPQAWFDVTGDGWACAPGGTPNEWASELYEAARQQQQNPNAHMELCLCNALQAMSSSDPAVATLIEAASGSYMASDGDLVLVDQSLFARFLDDATSTIDETSSPRLAHGKKMACVFTNYSALENQLRLRRKDDVRGWARGKRIDAIFYVHHSPKRKLTTPRYDPENLALARILRGGADENGSLLLLVHLWSEHHQAVAQCLVQTQRSLVRHFTIPTPERLVRIAENALDFMESHPVHGYYDRPYHILTDSDRKRDSLPDDDLNRGFLAFGSRNTEAVTKTRDSSRLLHRMCRNVFAKKPEFEAAVTDLVHRIIDRWHMDVRNDLEIDRDAAAFVLKLALDDGRSDRRLEDFHPEVRALLPFQDADVGRDICVYGYDGDDTVAKFKFELRQALDTIRSWGLCSGNAPFFSAAVEQAEGELTVADPADPFHSSS